MRTGIIAKKIGMSNYYTLNGTNIPVTVLHIDNCQVIERIREDSSDLDRVVIGTGKLKKIKKSKKGYFDKKNSTPFKYLKEFKISKEDELKSGDSSSTC